jgi:hypothetical protein
MISCEEREEIVNMNWRISFGLKPRGAGPLQCSDFPVLRDLYGGKFPVMQELLDALDDHTRWGRTHLAFYARLCMASTIMTVMRRREIKFIKALKETKEPDCPSFDAFDHKKSYAASHLLQHLSLVTDSTGDNRPESNGIWFMKVGIIEPVCMKRLGKLISKYRVPVGHQKTVGNLWFEYQHFIVLMKRFCSSLNLLSDEPIRHPTYRGDRIENKGLVDAIQKTVELRLNVAVSARPTLFVLCERVLSEYYGDGASEMIKTYID